MRFHFFHWPIALRHAVSGIPGVIDPNNFPFALAQNAAFAGMTGWVDFALPPPHAARITIELTQTPAQIVRDELGNDERGLRTPFVDVPTATYLPSDTVAHTTQFSGFCLVDGYNIPFTSAQLKQLYRNRGDYVQQFAREADEVVSSASG
jgi:hypothetical protein